MSDAGETEISHLYVGITVHEYVGTFQLLRTCTPSSVKQFPQSMCSSRLPDGRWQRMIFQPHRVQNGRVTVV